MPMMAVRERTRVSLEDEEVLTVVLDGTVMLIAAVEKREPVMLRREPGVGSCWQPASRARRTETSQYPFSQSDILLSLPFPRLAKIVGRLTVCRVR